MSLIIGAGVSIVCVYYSRKFLPLKGITNVSFLRLFLYLFYLLKEIYVAGFHVIGIIIKGQARTDIVTMRTKITNETLRIVLADSITLTPGSVLLDLTDDNITVVWLRGEDEPEEVDSAEALLMDGLENALIKAQL